MAENQIVLKFKRHEPGVCQKCGGTYDELFTAVVNSDESCRNYVMCKKCCMGLKKYVDGKNSAATEPIQQNNVPVNRALSSDIESNSVTVENISGADTAAGKVNWDYNSLITAGIFLVVALFMLFSKELLSFISYLAISFGILYKNNIIPGVGGAVLAVKSLINAIRLFSEYGSTLFSIERYASNYFFYGNTGVGSSVLIVATQVMAVLFCILLALSLYLSFGSLGVAAGIVKIVSIILSVSLSIKYDFSLAASDVIPAIIVIVGCFMLNKVFQDDYAYGGGSDCGDGIYF